MVSVYVQLLLILSFVVLPINCKFNLHNTNYVDGDLTLAETATHLIRKYFSEHSTTVIIIERYFYVILSDLNTRISDNILQNLNETIAVQLYYGKSDNQPWEYHVLIVDSWAAFAQIIWSFPRNDFDGDFQFLVILTYLQPMVDYMETIQHIFEDCEYKNIINVNILLNHSTLGVCMFKYKIFSESKCNVVQPYVHFLQVDGFDKLNEMFPQTLLNFHKCPLRVCAHQNHPMLMFEGNVSDPKPDENNIWSNLRGIDGQLIRILSRNLNFTIDLLPFSKERAMIENNTGYGCYAKLLNNKADIAIGGFSGSDPKRIALTPSVLYYQSPIVFVIRGKRELDCVNRLGRPFSLGLWQSIFGLLLIGVFLIHILLIFKQSYRQFVFGERNDTPLLNFFSAFLGYPVTRDPKGNLARYLLILWLVMTLIIRSAYQGSLYDSIRIDRFEKIPKKYDELFRRNYKFLITKTYADVGIFPKNQTIFLDRNHYDRLDLIARLEGNYATVALRDHVFSFLENNFRNGSDLKIVDEQIYQFQIAMYFQKHSIYASPINKYLNQFNYAGIIRHIVRSNAKDGSIFRDSKLAPPLRPMTNDRIWSLYKVFVRLMIFTVGIFILELLSTYCLRLRNILNWFH